MFPSLKKFFGDLDLQALKFVRPKKFVFLCGGILDPSVNQFRSVRDFIIKKGLLAVSNIEFVLAEEANKLYESTEYKDLISFEEDIAKIASVILVIAESPGSLAELGAFASYDPLKSSLRLIVDAKHEADKSFIREGPIRRLQRSNLGNVGFFDWTHDADNYVQADIAKHEAEILSFIQGHVNKASITQAAKDNEGLKPFYVLLWIIHLAQVISYDVLIKAALEIDTTFEKKDLKNKIFCLQLAKWVVRKTYSNKVYFYTTSDKDPFRYTFKSSVEDKDSIRKKTAVGAEFGGIESVPDPVRDEAIAARKS